MTKNGKAADLERVLAKKLKERDVLSKEIWALRKRKAENACPLSKGESFSVKGKRGKWLVKDVLPHITRPWKVEATSISSRGNPGKGSVFFTEEDELKPKK